MQHSIQKYLFFDSLKKTQFLTVVFFPPSFSGMSAVAVASSSPLSSFSSNNNHQLVPLIESCRTIKEFKQLHAQLIRSGNLQSTYQRLLSQCSTLERGGIEYARQLFDELPQPNVLFYNTMIKAYSDQSCPDSAVNLYLEMLNRGIEPNDYTFPFLLKAFNRETAIECGDELHVHALKFGLSSNSFVQSALIHMYALSGDVDTARELFDRCLKNDVVMWNAMMSGYNKSKQYEEAVKLFRCMESEKNVKPNSVTYLSVIPACTKLRDLESGTRVHEMIESDHEGIEICLSLQNALIDMYAACGELDTAWKIFERMKDKDVISWTAMVIGFANGGEVDRARSLFDEMIYKDLITWTAMINGYVSANRFKEALEIFREMQAAKIRPDEFTMASLLTACAQVGALGVGEWIRAYMDRSKIKRDVTVENALIDMYSKCGCVERAMQIFERMQRKNKFSWTTMITGLAVNGHGQEALVLYSKMLKSSMKPDEVTYVGVLSACTHSGLVERGRGYFFSMITEHGIMPNVTHYGCLVDLLARAGQLEEALQTINNMPMEPNSAVWTALLSACRVHTNIDIAELAAKSLVELEPDDSSAYIVLSNIYANCGKLGEAKHIKRLMTERGLKKIPGCSLIELDGIVHEFVAGDKSHPRSDAIYAKLEEICTDIGLAGYVPNTSGILGEEVKENAVFRHSEKLAIAFGLLSSRRGVTIRIVKNLRICPDCHNAIKFISEVHDREIVVRDRTRFHHFRNGTCSCNEFW